MDYSRLILNWCSLNHEDTGILREIIRELIGNSLLTSITSTEDNNVYVIFNQNRELEIIGIPVLYNLDTNEFIVRNEHISNFLPLNFRDDIFINNRLFCNNCNESFNGQLYHDYHHCLDCFRNNRNYQVCKKCFSLGKHLSHETSNNHQIVDHLNQEGICEFRRIVNLSGALRTDL